VDVVVVSYNSRGELRDCVKALVGTDDVAVIVVDNASTEPSLTTIEHLPLTMVQRDTNDGFGSGCNVGWRAGSSPFVLFLNPDTRFDLEGIRRLADALERTGAGVVAPRIVDDHGELVWSLRRYPTVSSIYGQALFAHRLLPTATWVDEIIRDPAVYEEEAAHDWASGACLLVRRDLLEELGGFDEGFFLYCEEIDLCQRMKRRGGRMIYVPGVTCVHQGGASASRAGLLPVLARSRLRYAEKWFDPPHAFAYRLGILLNALTHVLFSKSAGTRRSHAESIWISLYRIRS
jgi:N-acetylglucosaminyl-diphospho-decaprenol L-rhamnosyltransferase